MTTDTGRILPITPEALANATGTAPSAGATPSAGTATPVVAPIDPARRPDVLLRVRRDEGHEISSWWMIGAFLVTSGLVIALLSGVPYFA